MEPILEWLNSVEKSASEIYRCGSRLFSNDSTFSDFLKSLNEDESFHCEIVQKIAAFLKDNPSRKLFKIMPGERTHQISSMLEEKKKDICNGNITPAEMIETIAEIEFSEWNDIFLYVIGEMTSISREFEYLASKIQEHEDKIKAFISHLSPDLRPIINIDQLPDVWKTTILVVDDNTTFSSLLQKLLSNKAVVETAQNGLECLGKIKKHYFNAVISDINMPVMQGIEFYRQAKAFNHGLENKFLFCTSELSPEAKSYIEEKHLPYLLKPIEIKELYSAIDNLLGHS